MSKNLLEKVEDLKIKVEEISIKIWEFRKLRKSY